MAYLKHYSKHSWVVNIMKETIKLHIRYIDWYRWHIKSESENEVAQSCPTLCNPMDCSLPGSSVHEIFQARVLE